MDAVSKTGWSSAEVDSSLGKKQGKKNKWAPEAGIKLTSS